MESEILGKLKRTIFEYDVEGAKNYATKAIDEKINLLKALDSLTEAITEIGERFSRGDAWLPDLVGAADTMEAAMVILEAQLIKKDIRQKSFGTVVIGTVFGDIHTIGKTMVSTLLTAGGFKVYDLGVNIKADKFVETVKTYQSNILAMSALMTMTAQEQRKVVETFTKEGIRDNVKIMVGGGAITEQFADSIGADGYDPTAPGAVEVAKRFVSS